MSWHFRRVGGGLGGFVNRNSSVNAAASTGWAGALLSSDCTVFSPKLDRGPDSWKLRFVESFCDEHLETYKTITENFELKISIHLVRDIWLR